MTAPLYTADEKMLLRRGNAARRWIRKGSDPLLMLGEVVWGRGAPRVEADEVWESDRVKAKAA